MAAVVRLGDLCSGHGCFPPRANTSASPNVFCNGLAVHRLGDSWGDHSCGHSHHTSVLAAGSSKVFVNGRPIARVADSVACGSVAAQGSSSVFAG